MREARAWLDRRRPAPPAALRDAMDRALRRTPSAEGDVHAVLAAAALATLEAVAGGRGERGSAAELLAADALLTYACEAAAEAGPAALTALTAELGPERFEALAEERG